MRRQPGERDGDDNYRNKNPAAGGIFDPADSETAASRKAVSDGAGQGQNDCASARWIDKERCPITPPQNDQRKERQCAADSESEVLNGAIQNYEWRLWDKRHRRIRGRTGV